MDTIFSSASSSQKSAIKIIRISGSETKKIPKIFSFVPTQPRIASLRKIYDLNHNLIDNALIIYFPGPHTVTGEDVIELHIHGSTIIEKKIYEALVKNKNFRIANRGEFTKRAFLNGILDLTQAEALSDLINSETESQFKVSMSQFEGALSTKINSWRDEAVWLLSKLEALIDFADEELPPELLQTFNSKVLEMLEDMNKSLKYSRYVERIRNGFVVTLLGRPNVGKSSLINYLSNKRVAIVTDEAGTTRDIIEVTMDFKGFPVILNDTAGIRSAVTEVEKIGVKRALKKAESSDVILILSDDEDFSYPKLKSTCKKIFVHTKSDLKKTSNKGIHNISVKENTGIDELIDSIVDHLKSLTPKQDALLTRNRHIQAIKRSINALEDVKNFDLNINPELASENLRVVAKEIGNITNIIDVDEVLDDIFSSFCIGK